jgi:hypothetical protein
MNHIRSLRSNTLIALLITPTAVLYTAGSALSRWEPSLGWLFQSVIHVGELLAVVALARSAAAGSGPAARIGLGAAILGQVTLASAELIWPNSPDLGDVLFSIGPVLTGVGLAVAGISVLRAGRWTGWHRFTPVAVGGYVFVVMIPVLIGSGGTPAPAALWAIAGWDVLWTLVAVSALTRTATADPAGRRIAGGEEREKAAGRLARRRFVT